MKSLERIKTFRKEKNKISLDKENSLKQLFEQRMKQINSNESILIKVIDYKKLH